MDYYERLDFKYNLITLASLPVVLPLMWGLLLSADKPNPLNRKDAPMISKQETPRFEPLYAVITEEETEHFDEDYFSSSHHVKELYISSMDQLIETLNDYEIIDQVDNIYFSKRAKVKYRSNVFTNFSISLSRDLDEDEQDHISTELLD